MHNWTNNYLMNFITTYRPSVGNLSDVLPDNRKSFKLRLYTVVSTQYQHWTEGDKW